MGFLIKKSTEGGRGGGESCQPKNATFFKITRRLCFNFVLKVDFPHTYKYENRGFDEDCLSDC